MSHDPARLRHIAGHLGPHSQDTRLALLPLLVTPLTLDQVAERMGPGWTRRCVEYHWHTMRDQLGLAGRLARLALYRQLLGADDCWCERA